MGGASGWCVTPGMVRIVPPSRFALRIVLIAVLLASVTAIAGPALEAPGADDEFGSGPPDRTGLPDPGLHFETGFGLDFGWLNAGNMGDVVGVHGLLGLRYDRVQLLGELHAGLSSNVNGNFDGLGRAAVEARLSLWRGSIRQKPRHKPATSIDRAELWVEPGLGYELAGQDDHDPALHRRDLSFAIGFQTTAHDRDGFIGSYVALRVIAAERPDGEGRDAGLMVTFGSVFGR